MFKVKVQSSSPKFKLKLKKPLKKTLYLNKTTFQLNKNTFKKKIRNVGETQFNEYMIGDDENLRDKFISASIYLDNKN